MLHLPTDEDLEGAAHLLVEVDAAFGHVPYWTSVRNEGLPAARRLMELPWLTCAAVREDDVLVGFGGLKHISKTEAEVVRVMTRPGHTGRGVARHVCSALCDFADENRLDVRLEVIESSVVARQIYERLGFEVVCRRISTWRPMLEMYRPTDSSISSRSRDDQNDGLSRVSWSTPAIGPTTPAPTPGR